LLQFIENTSCQYERNSTLHTGVKAAEHVKKKYDYYLGKIKTTENFIRFSATKSMISGIFYKIHCAGQATITSQQWLLTELSRLRKAKE